MAPKIRSNPINIAPFVDVLLVLFVILVVAARFDGPGKDEIQKLNATIEALKGQIVLLKNTSKPKVVEKIIATPTASKVETKVVTKTVEVEDTQRINDLQGRVRELEAALVESKKRSESFDRGGGSGANIIFGTEGRITVNGVVVSEDFVYSLVRTISPDINIQWRGRGLEAADRFKEYVKQIGYGDKK
ncbi:hypothetical protein Sulku_2628 (plasmid) [Sulfuricurvum kujiense DSM 16994]|uniref:Uncharacterized protein n=1 Tax=Sulfuricurvum kujiense (strain ATCC BAA-921 / DSM 16994 / JCM 11577 / YK-1) TaxID=709032 RepID=E4U3L5_SULKY|nr:hypothetical protein [Sulfuricurvum kujiense]ADR35281.1 hypothetical protein Sulku_2628 [Sulfuricurvum kujiense DSM 16994]